MPHPSCRVDKSEGLVSVAFLLEVISVSHNCITKRSQCRRWPNLHVFLIFHESAGQLNISTDSWAHVFFQGLDTPFCYLGWALSQVWGPVVCKYSRVSAGQPDLLPHGLSSSNRLAQTSSQKLCGSPYGSESTSGPQNWPAITCTALLAKARHRDSPD